MLNNTLLNREEWLRKAGSSSFSQLLVYSCLSSPSTACRWIGKVGLLCNAGVCDCAPSSDLSSSSCLGQSPQHLQWNASAGTTLGGFNLALLEAAVVIFMECKRQREVSIPIQDPETVPESLAWVFLLLWFLLKVYYWGGQCRLPTEVLDVVAWKSSCSGNKNGFLMKASLGWAKA